MIRASYLSGFTSRLTALARATLVLRPKASRMPSTKQNKIKLTKHFYTNFEVFTKIFLAAEHYSNTGNIDYSNMCLQNAPVNPADLLFW